MDYTNLSNEEIASRIASADFECKKQMAIQSELKDELIKRGLKGQTIATLDNKGAVTLSNGVNKVVDLEKASRVLGAEVVGNLLEVKRAGVSLALSDFPANVRDRVAKEENGTIKMYVKRRY